jgi:hypothetical protein
LAKREERLRSRSVLCLHCGERVIFSLNCESCGSSYVQGLSAIRINPELIRQHFDEDCFADQVLMEPRISFLEPDGSVVYDHSPDQPRRWAYFDEEFSESIWD